MRLRFICFFVCETYLSACSAVLTDEYTVGGAKRHLLMDPEDDVYDLPFSINRDYADFWHTEGQPTLSEQDNGECCPKLDANAGVHWPAHDGPSLAPKCQISQPCGATQTSIPVSPPWRRGRVVPDNTPLYDVVIYPTAQAGVY